MPQKFDKEEAEAFIEKTQKKAEKKAKKKNKKKKGKESSEEEEEFGMMGLLGNKKKNQEMDIRDEL